MAESVYEGLLIFDANAYARDPGSIQRGVDELIKTAGGTLLASRLWEERRLAYPVKGQRKGIYWLAYFKLDGSKVKGLNRQCQLYEQLLRHLILKVDPRLVDTLVAHAKTDTPRRETPAAAPPKGRPVEQEAEEVAEV